MRPKRPRTRLSSFARSMVPEQSCLCERASRGVSASGQDMWLPPGNMGVKRHAALSSRQIGSLLLVADVGPRQLHAKEGADFAGESLGPRLDAAFWNRGQL